MTSESIIVALDPALGLDVEALAAAWNADDACRAQAEASALTVKGPAEMALPWLQQALLILAPVASAAAGAAGALIGDAAKDALKEALKARMEKLLAGKPKPQVRIEWVRQPDGGLLMVVGQAE